MTANRSSSVLFVVLLLVCVIAPATAWACGDYYERPFPWVVVAIATAGGAGIAVLGLLPAILCGTRMTRCEACGLMRRARWTGWTAPCPNCGTEDGLGGARVIYGLWLGLALAIAVICFGSATVGAREETIIYRGWGLGLVLGTVGGMAVLHPWRRQRIPRATVR